MNKKFRVALAAFGMSGRLFHAPFLHAHPGFELVKILERQRNDAREEYPEVEIVRSFDAILQDPEIDVVVVNTPSLLHVEMTRAALQAGKHVVVEKPFTPTAAEGRLLVEMAQEGGLVLSVYHNRCFASGFHTARKLLAENSVGKLKSMTMNLERYRPEPGSKKWKEEPNPAAGLLYDIGVHLFDESLQLFGTPEFITADLRIQRDNGKVNDFFAIRLDYPNHFVNLNASLLARIPAPAYVIHGDKGSYVKHSQDIQEKLLIAGVRPLDSNWAEENESLWGVLSTETGSEKYPTVSGSYLEFYHQLYHHLNKNSPLPVSLSHALRTIEMIELAILSSDKKCTLRCAFDE